MFLKLKTYRRLGLINLARVAAYRMSLSAGIHPVMHISANIGGNDFFKKPLKYNSFLNPSKNWENESLYFFRHRVPLKNGIPAWLSNPFNGKSTNSSHMPWWKISDFDSNVGDIKIIWEPSRFDWVLALSQRIKAGDEKSLKSLNLWLSDWCKNNPAFYGPNWKCGQEASIRLIHMAVASLILGQREMLPDLARLVKAHLSRIYPTLSYALAQNNNHAISEAAALYIGGSWCEANGIKIGQRYARMGIQCIENRVKHLISPDGSFSQYSLNYHRLLIDILCVVEVWRRWRDLDAFSSLFYHRAKAATHWMFAMVEPNTGDAPNLGGNDGACLLPLANVDYRDFRPSVQLAMALFDGKQAYGNDGPWNVPFKWLGVKLPEDAAPAPSNYFADDGGFAVLRRKHTMTMLRYPRFRFRPSQADALHLDLWVNGENLLRDAGTYSYADPWWYDYFSGTVCHNTVQFDGRNQMPRLSRFLWGEWLKTSSLKGFEEDEQTVRFAAGYRDGYGANHHRSINLGDTRMRCEDQVAGFVNMAVLRWRLAPGDWKIYKNFGTSCAIHRYNPAQKLEVHASIPIIRCELIQGWESRYYLEKNPLPVLEIEVRQPGTLITEVCWSA